jgi:hypothetical protein
MAPENRPDSAPGNLPKLVAAWLLVGIPFAWGVFVTAGNALALFK